MPKLSIDIEARLAQFQSSLDNISRQGEQTASRLNSAFGGLKTTIAGLVAGLSAGALVSFFEHSIDAAAQLDDLAERTGASVEELSKLSQVARISGTNIEIVETFLVKLNKALHDTDEEAKGANRALEAIGLSAAELRGLDPAEAMRRVAVALSGFADGGGKTAAILALTGKSAAQALPFLKDLVTETGIGAKVTAEQAAAAEELQKSVRRLTTASSEAGEALAREFVPALQRIATAAGEAYREGGKLYALWVALGGVAANVLGLDVDQKAASRIKEINEQLAVAEKQLKSGTLKPAGASTSLFGFLIPDVKLSEEALAKVRQNVAALKAERESLLPAKAPKEEKPALGFQPKAEKPGRSDNTFDNAVKGLEQEALKVQEVTRFEEVLAGIRLGHYGQLSDAQRKLLLDRAAEVDVAKALAREDKEREEGLKKNQEDQERRTEEDKKRLFDIRDKALDSIDATRSLRREVDGLVEAYGKGLLSLQQLNEAATDPRLRDFLKPVKTDMDRLNEALKEGDISWEKYLEVVKRLKGEAEQTSDVARDLGLTFQSAFEDAIIGGKKFRDVLQGVIQDIGRIIVRKGITEPIGTAITKGVSESTKAGGFLGGAVDWFKGLFGGNKAEGGPLQSGRWYIAGEHGPEPIWGGGPGAFAAGYGGGGGVSVVQHIHVDSRSDIGSVMAAMRAAKDAAVAEIRDGQRRGR